MLTLLNLLSAIALLVWGTHIVRTGILRVYGSQLRRVLSHSVTKRPQAFAAGIGVTALVQSSNATALLTTSFVAQGLMALAPALAIMLGADVGTALMARVLTFDLSWLSPLLIFAGVILFLSRKQSRAGQIGRVAIGLGLLILALQLIVEAARPIAESNSIEALFASLTGDLLLDALVGALFAIITYSSLAAVLLTATLAGSSMISLPVAIGLVIGANIGSGILALLSSGMQSAAGRQVALGSLLYKLLGLLLVLPLMQPLVAWMASLKLDAATLVILFHLAYNSLRCLLLLPTVNWMARLCRLLLPERAREESVAQPRHLDRTALGTPSLALANAVRETLRIGDIVERMLQQLLEVLRHGSAEAVQQIHRLDEDLDTLHGALKLYLAQMPRDDLPQHDSHRWAEIIELAVNLQHAGDLIERMASRLSSHKRERLSFSESGLEELIALHGLLLANLRLGLNVFLGGNRENARRLLEEKHRFRREERKLAHAHVGRLSQQVVQSIETSDLHLQLIADMKRLNTLFCSSAYALLDSNVSAPEEPASPEPGEDEAGQEAAAHTHH